MRLAWISILAACGTSPPPSNMPQPSPVPKAVPVEAAPADDASTAPAPLLATRGDLDGVAGDERVVLERDGTLKAGDATITVALDHADPVFDRQHILEVVSLGGARRGVLLAMPTDETEDPPNRYRVYLYDRGTLRQVFDQVIGVYGLTALKFDAGGTASYVESGWMACSRDQGKPSVMKQVVTLALDAAGKRLEEKQRQPSGDVQQCDELAACPFVYVMGDGEPRLAGEILRNIRGAAAATLQALAIDGRGEGPLTLRLAEEKLEVTFLDEIYVEVDGVRVLPRACTATPAPAYCAADGKHHVMRYGDTLDLSFDSPAHVASVLFARGYYVPTPTAATR